MSTATGASLDSGKGGLRCESRRNNMGLLDMLKSDVRADDVLHHESIVDCHFW